MLIYQRNLFIKCLDVELVSHRLRAFAHIRHQLLLSQQHLTNLVLVIDHHVVVIDLVLLHTCLEDLQLINVVLDVSCFGSEVQEFLLMDATLGSFHDLSDDLGRI